MKSVSLCPIGSSCNLTSVSIIKLEQHQSIQSASDKQQSEETLEGIVAIVDLKPNGIVAHSYFLFVFQNTVYILFFYGGILLLECQPPCTKTPITGQLQKSIQIIFTRNFDLFFLFLFCFERTSNDLFLIYAFENDCCL